jgi:hypothetical protein
MVVCFFVCVTQVCEMCVSVLMNVCIFVCVSV